MQKIGLLFPGQGAQTVGMGEAFYKESLESKKIFDEADEVIPGLTNVIFKGPEEKLTSTAFCQPGIFTFSIAALECLKAHAIYQKITPQFSAGLSLGELSAVTASGALGFRETLVLVERRSYFMEQACLLKKGGMVAVIGFPEDQLITICKNQGVEVANFNSPDQIVITGDADKVLTAAEAIKLAGAKRVISLSVGGAFHSSLMKSAVPLFKSELESYSFQNPNFPVVANVDGSPTNLGQDIQKNLETQITSSVQWVKTIEYMATQGVTTFLEIGPGTVLKGLIRKINRDLKVFCIQSPDDIEKLDFS